MKRIVIRVNGPQTLELSGEKTGVEDAEPDPAAERRLHQVIVQTLPEGQGPLGPGDGRLVLFIGHVLDHQEPQARQGFRYFREYFLFAQMGVRGNDHQVFLRRVGLPCILLGTDENREPLDRIPEFFTDGRGGVGTVDGRGRHFPHFSEPLDGLPEGHHVDVLEQDIQPQVLDLPQAGQFGGGAGLQEFSHGVLRDVHHQALGVPEMSQDPIKRVYLGLIFEFRVFEERGIARQGAQQYLGAVDFSQFRRLLVQGNEGKHAPGDGIVRVGQEHDQAATPGGVVPREASALRQPDIKHADRVPKEQRPCEGEELAEDPRD